MQYPILCLAICILAPPAYTHGGGLNRYGCHNNHKTGDYHCHRSPARLQVPKLSSDIRSVDTDLVKSAQKLLNHLGCEAGHADGQLGIQTANAVKRFQGKLGKVQDGQISHALISDLSSAVIADIRCK